MARQAGKVIDFAYNSVAIEDELNSLTMSVDVNLPEVTAFGDAANTFVEGLPSTTIDVAGYFDPAASQGDATIYGRIGNGAATALLETTGSAAGTNSPTYSVSAFVSSYTITSDVGGATTYTATLQGSGANTRAVS